MELGWAGPAVGAHPGGPGHPSGRAGGRPLSARRWARELLRSLGVEDRLDSVDDTPPALEWARCGAMELSGCADGPPLLAPGPLASCARGAYGALRSLAPGLARDLDAAALLGERAAILGLRRRGTTAPGGNSRLVRARDGWLALTLARADDVELLPAWLSDDARPRATLGEDPWSFVVERVACGFAAPLVERARLLGLPAAVSAPPAREPPPWQRTRVLGAAKLRPKSAAPVVVDLSALWAGPLCTELLALSGARVIKVESTRRPDGARAGPTAFYDLLNARKACVALDFAEQRGRAQLRTLLAHADIVVEASRPRAMRQLGVDAESLVAEVPGLVWVSLTGYGRREPEASWVAFGDDAAVASGLAAATGPQEGPPLFCGDAIADPLSGVHAALAGLAAFREGGGRLVEIALRDVTAAALAAGDARSGAEVRRRGDGWEVVADGCVAPVAPPRARPPAACARPLGADTQAILAEFGA